MRARSNLVLGVAFLVGALLLGSLTHAPFLWALSLFLASLGVFKILNSFSDCFPHRLKRIVCWGHSLLFETIAIIATFFMRPIGYLTNQKKGAGTPGGVPLLLIHGYIHDSSAWLFLKQALRGLGLGPIYTLNLSHPFRSIYDYAEQVAKKAEEIALETGEKKLVLIGHSMGGLVTSLYAAKLAPSTEEVKVITIGSPLQGTYAALLALGPNGKEMRHGSPFLQEIGEVFKTSPVCFYHIGSSADQMILPPSSALTGLHPEREYQIDDIGHMTLLFSPRVAKKISEWLSFV